MKKSKKKYPYIIEFNGIPGSGKTTIANELNNILRKEKKSVCLYSDYYKRNCHNRLKQIKEVCFYFLPFIKYFSLLMKITKKIKRDHITFKYILSSAVNFCGKIDLYRNSKVDYIIIDQGIIQEIESIFFLNEFDTEFDDIFRLINKYFERTIIINTEIKIEIACDRINTRKNGTSRADGLKNYEEQRKMLEHENRVFEKIRKSNHIIQAIKIKPNNIKDDVNTIIEYMRKEKIL